ncbi:tetratricopeptide repeat protein [Streptomyces sp. NPDC055961]|uniref:tetratricopeptide repeat protein n=1 Tax=Streptomyces sp. NPDC055961 TaxID=3345666 RepID=UPI0035E362AF
MHTEPLYRPWGTPTADFWQTAVALEAGGSAATGPGESVRERLVHVAATAAGGNLDDAVTLAEQIDRDATAEFGENHRDTIEAREVRGYLAHLTGDQNAAVGWYLHSVRLRAGVQGPDHPDTADAARRAYSLWRSVPQGPESQRLGVELLTTVTDILGADSVVASHTRNQLSRPKNQALSA